MAYTQLRSKEADKRVLQSRAALLSLLSKHKFAAISAAMTAATSAEMLPAFLAKDDAAAMRILADHVSANRTAVYALIVAAGPATQRAIMERSIAQVGAVPTNPVQEKVKGPMPAPSSRSRVA
jgi:hypothetical protein